jgi:ATP-binding cassette, subfamily B, bacterial
MILSYHGRKTRVAECREELPTGRDGATARTLAQAARAFGLEVKVLAADVSDFESLPLPAVVHWRFNHFVVVERWSSTSVGIVDPARGRMTTTPEEFDAGFTGVVLIFRPSPNLARPERRREPRWSHYLRQLLQFKGSLLLAVGCSLLLQLAGLAIPLLTAFVVDRLIPASESTLLPLLAFATALLVVNQLTISNLRERLLLYLKAHLDLRMTTSFVDHLLSLPLPFFERRGSGDLIGRLASSATVREALSTPAVSAILDGTFALGYLAILLLYDVAFAVLVLALGAVQVLIAVAMTRRLNLRLRAELTARATSYDYLAQAIAGIDTLKASGGETRALGYWSPLLAEEVSATVAVNRVQSAITTLSTSTRLLFPLMLLLLGAHRVLAEELSLGVALALIALATAVLTPLTSLITDVQQLQLAGAHLDRVADVLNSEVEQRPAPSLRREQVQGTVELRDLDFSYDAGAPPLLREISLVVPAGSMLAITGRSGSGKSTLAKLLLGLYRPVRGEILYDGVSLGEYDLHALRGQFGVVLQDPALFSGSIRENISFHRPGMSLDEVIRLAKLAAIHDEIAAMPLGYETLVTHVGGSVSGGQRQRIALARALAREPRILVLDEATSHLDSVTEQIIHENLRRLSCTRIVIAHRLSTIRDAHDIVVLENGSIVEQGTHLELMDENGPYSELVRRQLEPDQEPEALLS